MTSQPGRGNPDSPTQGLEFDIAIPDGLEVTRAFGGYDLTISAGTPGDPQATTISIGAARDAGGPVTLDEHVARDRADAASDRARRHLVDEAPFELAGHPAWWRIESCVTDGPAFVLERWLLVRDGVGWTVRAQMPWVSVHLVRDGVLGIVATLRFRGDDGATSAGAR
jgi:hypothetical protein